MNNLIPVATLKEIGAIEHRIHDAALHPAIKTACKLSRKRGCSPICRAY